MDENKSQTVIEMGATNGNSKSDTCVFSWRDVTFETLTGKTILHAVSGNVKAGEVLALMGPSGCGKTTLLNCLAQRSQNGNLSGQICINGSEMTRERAAKMSTYVQQEDALIGALTVRETVDFAAQLSLNVSREERARRVDSMLEEFGLSNQANQLVGTPIRKGISGGQKRRLSVASQLITLPKIVFLDEPTSGLDSLAAYEVVNLLGKVARDYGIIVIASIHSPSTATFKLFDKVLLLSKGKTVYHGSVDLEDYFMRAGSPIPNLYNPADHLLDVTNVDFSKDEEQLQKLLTFWESSPEAKSTSTFICEENCPNVEAYSPGIWGQTVVLLHRLWIKSTRDVIAYGVRLAMYIGLALMMGTVWLRLDNSQDKIVPFSNAMFFSSAFMSFMAVAYIPSFLEDRASLVKDRANGLYGVTPFLISNTLIGLPFLAIIALSFALITYWLIDLNQSTQAFFRYFLFLFLDLLAAESLVVLVSSLFPIFVASLAITAFANGLFMSTGGFLVPPNILNPFYHYFFYQIDYQRFTFEALMTNEFTGRIFNCDSSCFCMYNTSLADKCQISGEGVLGYLGYGNVGLFKWGIILLSISLVMRFMGLFVLHFTIRSVSQTKKIASFWTL